MWSFWEHASLSKCYLFFELFSAHLLYASLQREHDRLLQSWDARPAGKKFQIACMFHDGDDIRWHNNLVEWVRRRAVRILTISEQ
jgi:hypothetical protein